MCRCIVVVVRGVVESVANGSVCSTKFRSQVGHEGASHAELVIPAKWVCMRVVLLVLGCSHVSLCLIVAVEFLRKRVLSSYHDVRVGVMCQHTEHVAAVRHAFLCTERS